MKYLQPIFTMPRFEPNAKMCCEACVFGSGEHAEWCDRHRKPIDTGLRLKLHANGIRGVDAPGTFPVPQDYIALRG